MAGSLVLFSGVGLILVGCSAESIQSAADGSVANNRAAFGLRDVALTIDNKTSESLSVSNCYDIEAGSGCQTTTIAAGAFGTFADFSDEAFIEGLGLAFSAVNPPLAEPFIWIGVADAGFTVGVNGPLVPHAWGRAESYPMSLDAPYNDRIIALNGRQVELVRGADTDDINLAIRVW